MVIDRAQRRAEKAAERFEREGARKNFLQRVDGYKTTLAAIYWGAVMPSLLLLYPEGVPPEMNKWFVIAGLFLTSVGVGHKWYKKTHEVE